MCLPRADREAVSVGKLFTYICHDERTTTTTTTFSRRQDFRLRNDDAAVGKFVHVVGGTRWGWLLGELSIYRCLSKFTEHHFRSAPFCRKPGAKSRELTAQQSEAHWNRGVSFMTKFAGFWIANPPMLSPVLVMSLPSLGR